MSDLNRSAHDLSLYEGNRIVRFVMGDRNESLIIVLEHESSRTRHAVAIQAMGGEATLTGHSGLMSLVGRKIVGISEFTPTVGDLGFEDGKTARGETLTSVGCYITTEYDGDMECISASVVFTSENFLHVELELVTPFEDGDAFTPAYAILSPEYVLIAGPNGVSL